MFSDEQEKIASIIVRKPRGRYAHEPLTPSLRRDRTYTVTKDRRNVNNFVYVRSYTELVDHIRNGYGVFMSVNNRYPTAFISALTIRAQNPQHV